MAEPMRPDVIAYVCANCVSKGTNLPRQWRQNGALVLVRDLPCSGKMEGQYLLNAFEGGITGLCVVACPRGECQLAQGNYRAEIRIGTIKRLLDEIGVESDRAELLFCGLDDPPDRLEGLVRDAVGRICSLGESPIRRAAPSYAEG